VAQGIQSIRKKGKNREGGAAHPGSPGETDRLGDGRRRRGGSRARVDDVVLRVEAGVPRSGSCLRMTRTTAARRLLRRLPAEDADSGETTSPLSQAQRPPWQAHELEAMASVQRCSLAGRWRGKGTEWRRQDGRSRARELGFLEASMGKASRARTRCSCSCTEEMTVPGKVS
jgi:hypothetical protein